MRGNWMAWGIACWIAAMVTPICGQSWSEFRGPNGVGRADAPEMPATWLPENTRWQTAIPGTGWSSPVVAENQIWMTTSLTSEDRVGAAAKELRLLALCVDRQSGEILHQVSLFDVAHPPELHPQNSYASPTPVIDGDAVYCNFGTMGTACVDRQSGTVRWTNRDFEFDHETGPGSSPVIYGDLLIVHCDGTDQQFVVAFDKQTGKVVWNRPRSGELHPEGMMKKAFSTPTVVRIEGRDVLLSPGANWLYAYDPATGGELWKTNYDRLGFSNVPRPIVHEGLALICTGFNKPALQAVCIVPGPEWRVGERVWEYDVQVPTIPTPIVVEGMLFMVNDRGIATCLDASSGSVHWQKRLSGEFTASPVFADGKLYFCDRSGRVSVVAPATEFRLLATNQLDAAIFATPAIVDGQIIVRTEKTLYRIDP